VLHKHPQTHSDFDHCADLLTPERNGRNIQVSLDLPGNTEMQKTIGRERGKGSGSLGQKTTSHILRPFRDRAEQILEEANAGGWLSAATTAFVRDRLHIEHPEHKRSLQYHTVDYWVKQYKAEVNATRHFAETSASKN
jgi:hypothetical protein